MPAPKTQRADCACLYRLRESPQILPSAKGYAPLNARTRIRADVLCVWHALPNPFAEIHFLGPSNLQDEWVEQAHTGNDFTRVQVFAEEHITASGLGRCNDERIVKRDASGLV